MVRDLVVDGAGRLVGFRGEALTTNDLQEAVRRVYARAGQHGVDRREQRRMKNQRRRAELQGSVFMPGEL